MTKAAVEPRCWDWSAVGLSPAALAQRSWAPTWLALALVIAGWYAAMGWGFSVVLQTRWWVVAVPVVWVLQEWLRSRFPWGGLGWGVWHSASPNHH